MIDTQPIDVPLAGGLQEDIDEHLVPMGGWLMSRNLRRHKKAGFSKRFGTSPYTLDVVDQSDVDSCVVLGALGNTPLLVDANNHVFEWSAARNAWIDRSIRQESSGPQDYPLSPVTLEHEGLYGLQNKIPAMDWCRTEETNGSALIHVALEIEDTVGDPQILVFVVDEDTNALVSGPTIFESGYAPRLFVCGSGVSTTVVMVYAEVTPSTKIWATTKTPTGSFAAPTTLATDNFTGFGSRVWDAQGVDATSFFLAYPNAVDNIKYRYFSLGPITLVSAGDSTTTEIEYTNISIALGETDRMWVCFSTATGGIANKVMFTYVNVPFCAEDFLPVNAASLILPSAEVGIYKRLTIGKVDDSHAYIMASCGEDFPELPIMETSIVSNVGTVVTSISNTGFRPASRPFMGPDDRLYVWIRDLTYLGSLAGGPSSNPLAGTLYLIDTQATELNPATGRVVSRGPVRALEVSETSFMDGRIVASPIVHDSAALCPAAMLRQLQTQQRPIERVTATWDDPARYRFLQLGGSAYVQPLEMFDRNRSSEIGFHKIPDPPQDLSDDGAGNLSEGTYSYLVVLRHVNSAGETVRSAPSGASEVTLVAARKAAMNIFLPSFTDKQSLDIVFGGPAKPEYIVVELYRTLANGSTFYLCDEAPLSLIGIGTGALSGFQDNLSDEDLGSKPIIYTQQQAANLAPPSLKSIVEWQGRLCGIGPDGHTIWISSFPQAGEQVTFNEAFNAYVPQTKLTAVEVLDDKLIAFGADSAWFMSGQPADSLGNGNTLVAEAISVDVGCIDQRGILRTGVGLIFRDRRAFSLLGRNLQIENIGLDVQDLVAENPVVSSATYADFDREARFVVRATEDATTGLVLRYNLTVGAWMTSDYLNPSAAVPTLGEAIVATTKVGNAWHAAFADGQVIQETRDEFLDSGFYIESEILTPWIRVGAVGGYQRTRRVLVQAERMSPHNITIEIDQDYLEDSTQVEEWTSGEIASLPEYPITKLSTHLEFQKGSAVRVRVKDSTPLDEDIGTGEGPRYFGLTLEIGVKRGIGKQLSERN